VTDKSSPRRVETDEIRETRPADDDDSLGRRIDRDTELAEDLAADTDDDAEASRRFEELKEGPRPGDLPTEERP
jgi:hypothetical protein